MKPNTLKNILIDLFLLVIVGIVQFYTVIFVLLMSFGFFICGDELLNLWNRILGGFLISLIIFAFQLFVAYKTFRLRTKFFAVGLWFIVLSFLYAVIPLGIDTFSKSEYYEEFDEMKWKESKHKPISMIRTLMDNKRLIGLSRTDIIEKLGTDTLIYRYSDKSIQYQTDWSDILILYLEQDTVTNIELYCND